MKIGQTVYLGSKPAKVTRLVGNGASGWKVLDLSVDGKACEAVQNVRDSADGWTLEPRTPVRKRKK